MTTFLEPFYRIADFDEQISIIRRTGTTSTTIVVPNAASSRRKAATTDGGGDRPPRVSLRWRVPANETTKAVRRGDVVVDSDSRRWLVASTSVSPALGVVSLQTVGEQLFPGDSDKLDVYRLDSTAALASAASLNAARRVARNVPALVRSRVATKTRGAESPFGTTTIEISLWVRGTIDAKTADVVVLATGETFETTAYRAPEDLSEWGVLTARRIIGDGGVWNRPTSAI